MSDRNVRAPVAVSRCSQFGTSSFCCACLYFLQPADAALISTFQAGDSGWHLGTLGVGNLDSTPDLEIVVPYRDSAGHWFLDAFKFGGQQMAGFPYSSGTEEIN